MIIILIRFGIRKPTTDTMSFITRKYEKYSSDVQVHQTLVIQRNCHQLLICCVPLSTPTVTFSTNGTVCSRMHVCIHDKSHFSHAR